MQGVIVFDNVDHYVDVDQSLFTSAVSAFINEALRVEHQLVVILTCRPRISYASVRFREIYLRGLDANEALLLFDTKIPGGLKEGNRQTILRIHELTRGHPLWADHYCCTDRTKARICITDRGESASRKH